jgi:phosphohistidine phosphatase
VKRAPARAVPSRTLYLVRHAIAAERGPDWLDDAKRPLTHKGIARMREIVDGLRELEAEIDVLLTSPLVRARQTAELVMQGLKPAPSLAVVTALEPGGPPAGVLAAIGQYGNAKGIALVGHEPGLGELAAHLIGTPMPLVFKKGGVCRIDLAGAAEPGAGQLIWLATPAMLRALGSG